MQISHIQKKTIYSCDESFFDSDNELSFYWAGFMAADGNISNQGDICLSLKLSDKTHIEKFAKHINSNAPIKILDPKNKIINGVSTKTSGSALIRFRSPKWIVSLCRFNVVPNKTKTYYIPNEIVKSDMFRHFIRGYFDGDGWFAVRSRRISFGICGNYSTVLCIKDALQKLCVLQSNPKIYKQKSIFKVEFSHQHDVMKISDFLYNNSEIYLDRKFKLSKLSKIYDNNTSILNIDKIWLQEALIRLKSYKLVALELGCSKSSIANYVKKYNL